MPRFRLDILFLPLSKILNPPLYVHDYIVNTYILYRLSKSKLFQAQHFEKLYSTSHMISANPYQSGSRAAPVQGGETLETHPLLSQELLIIGLPDLVEVLKSKLGINLKA